MDAGDGRIGVTATTLSKTDVLARFDQERMVWERLLAEVGEERMEQPGVTGEWTFKDVVAHLNGWRRRWVDRIDAAGRGVEPPPTEWAAEVPEIEGETEDEMAERVNAWLYARSRDQPLTEILAESRRQWDSLREMIAAWSEADLNDPARAPWNTDDSVAQLVLNGDMFSHFHEEHEPAIRAWLASFNDR
jgi:uncharacterized damage-inducible protein DinB